MSDSARRLLARLVLLTPPAPLAVCRRSSLRRVSLVLPVLVLLVLVLPVLVLLVLVLPVLVLLVVLLVLLVQGPALARKVLRWLADTRGLPGLARLEMQLLRERRSAHPRPPQRTIRRLSRTVRAPVTPLDPGARLDCMAHRTPDPRALKLRVLLLELTRPS